MGEQSGGGVTNEMNAIVRSRVQPDENGIIRPFVDVVIGEDVLTLEPGAANEIGARLIDSAAQAVDLWAFISVLKFRGVEDDDISEILNQVGKAVAGLRQQPKSALEVVTDPQLISKLGGAKDGG